MRVGRDRGVVEPRGANGEGPARTGPADGAAMIAGERTRQDSARRLASDPDLCGRHGRDSDPAARQTPAPILDGPQQLVQQAGVEGERHQPDDPEIGALAELVEDPFHCGCSSDSRS